MATVDSKKIVDVVKDIKNKNFVLPAIQREFVWEKNKILNFYDSIMRGYPIGSFLFWIVEKENINKIHFYELLEKYHDLESKHNQLANIESKNEVFAILDGQQRLSALSIGLIGSYAIKTPRAKDGDPLSYPEKFLHVNLLSKLKKIEGSDRIFEFEFLTKEEANISQENTVWFKVSDILTIDDNGEIYNYLSNSNLVPHENKKSFSAAMKLLSDLHNNVHKYDLIHFFKVNDQKLNDVLKIFLRVNNGGTKLENADLLLSISSAQWKTLDARKLIPDLVDEIKKNSGITFDMDDVLKTCLVLNEIKDISFNVENFSKDEIPNTIEQNWERTTDCLQNAIALVKQYGYVEETLPQKYPIIPIAYYLFKNCLDKNFLTATEYKNDRESIRKWLLASILKRNFPSRPDTTLKLTRDIIQENLGSFPLDKLIDENPAISLKFSKENIEDLLDLKYGDKITFTALSFLYPSLNYDFNYHIDHLHAQSLFKTKSLTKMGFSKEKIGELQKLYNNIGNLCILRSHLNIEKSDEELTEWIKSNFSTKPEQDMFIRDNIIPNVSFSINNFETFLQERKKLMKTQFNELLSEFVKVE